MTLLQVNVFSQRQQSGKGTAVAGRGHHIKIIVERGKDQKVVTCAEHLTCPVVSRCCHISSSTVKMLWSLLFVSLIGSAHLDCKVRVPSKIHNVTLNGTTSQSSNYTDNIMYTSERATDGNETTCANTKEQTNQWWRIDLLGVYNISSVHIFNINADHSDITGAQIHIGTSHENNDANSTCQIIRGFIMNQWNEVKCNTTMLGRYISVSYSNPKKAVVLCEVRISGTRKEQPFELIKENKTWADALYDCRDKNMHLASILDKETQAWAELMAEQAKTPFVWLGLHYTCTLDFWFWVEDHRVEFNHWAPNNKTEACDMSGAMERGEEHLWFSMSDYQKYNFLCAK